MAGVVEVVWNQKTRKEWVMLFMVMSFAKGWGAPIALHNYKGIERMHSASQIDSVTVIAKQQNNINRTQ